MQKTDYLSAVRMAAKGSQEAQAALDTLWDDYARTDIPCFTCHQPTGYPPAGTMPLPERLDIDPSRVILVPLCRACWGLPIAVRTNRAMTVLRDLYSHRRPS